MSEFSQDSRPIVAEGMPPTAFRVQAGDDAPALNANLHPSAVIEPYDAQEGRSAAGLLDPTLGDFEAKSVASGSSENLSGSTAEANKVCIPRIPVPSSKNLDYQTFELHTGVKRMIARRTHLADGGSALVAFWAMSTWFRDALEVSPLLLSAALPRLVFCPNRGHGR